jgi:hypothetical protein
MLPCCLCAAFRLSELRIIELLEGLCERVAPYALWTPSAKWADANPTEDAERQWIRVSGQGAHVQGATGARMRHRLFLSVTRCLSHSCTAPCVSPLRAQTSRCRAPRAR